MPLGAYNTPALAHLLQMTDTLGLYHFDGNSTERYEDASRHKIPLIRVKKADRIWIELSNPRLLVLSETLAFAGQRIKSSNLSTFCHKMHVLSTAKLCLYSRLLPLARIQSSPLRNVQVIVGLL